MNTISNNLKLVLLVSCLTGIVMFVGNSIAGSQGLVLAFVFALVTQGLAYWNSDKIALSMNGAYEINESSAPQLFRLVRTLADKAQLPMPKVYLTPESSPNAFATGRDPEHSAVAFTQGLLETLNEEELAGVVAHELGHIKNRDVFISTVAAVLAGIISSITQFTFMFGSNRENNNSMGMIGFLLSIIVAPLLATIIQLMISRSREYEADATAVALTGKPQGLARALEKISGLSKQIHTTNLQPAFSSLYITNPFTGEGLNDLFSTHPSIEKRIKRILELKNL